MLLGHAPAPILAAAGDTDYRVLVSTFSGSTKHSTGLANCLLLYLLKRKGKDRLVQLNKLDVGEIYGTIFYSIELNLFFGGHQKGVSVLAVENDNIKEIQTIKTVTKEKDEVVKVVVSSCGKMLALGHLEGFVIMFEIQGSNRIEKRKAKVEEKWKLECDNEINDMSFSHDCEVLAVVVGGQIRILEVSTSTQIETISVPSTKENEQLHVSCCQFIPMNSSGYYMIVAAHEIKGPSSIFKWEISFEGERWKKAHAIQHVMVDDKPLNRLSLDNTGDYVALGGKDGRVAVWSTKNFKKINFSNIHDLPVMGLVFQGFSVISSSADYSLAETPIHAKQFPLQLIMSIIVVIIAILLAFRIGPFIT